MGCDQSDTYNFGCDSLIFFLVSNSIFMKLFSSGNKVDTFGELNPHVSEKSLYTNIRCIQIGSNQLILVKKKNSLIRTVVLEST